MKQIWCVFTALGILAWPGQAAWKIETIESGDSVGGGASLTLNSAGVPSVCYYRPNTTAGFLDLYYARRSGTSWAKEPIYTGFSEGGAGRATSLSVTEAGTPFVTFTHAGTLFEYSIRSGGSWTSATTISNSGGGFSSALWHGTEASPQPVAAYYDQTAGDLRYAFFSGTWMTTPLDTTGDSGAFCSMAEVGSEMGIAYIDNGKLGFYNSINGGTNWGAYSDNQFAPFNAINATACALAMAPSKNDTGGVSHPVSAHILYYYATTGQYLYVTNDTENGLWTSPELVQQSAVSASAFFGCSIAVGSDGVVRVAYLDYANFKLVYAARENGSWSAETVDTSTGGANCTLRLDSDNSPHIAYGALTENSGNYFNTGVRYASIVEPLAFKVLGKARRTTKGKSLTIRGTASNSAASVEWKVGKGKFKKGSISNGQWSIRCRPLKFGKNIAQFRAVSATGEKSSIRRVKILRK